ncbi:MAG: hypothetical protein HY360_24605 [Verrucomicrobia bacterium]|nr:hypothetical protein [Verrucomicrobiota bacterium]
MQQQDRTAEALAMFTKFGGNKEQIYAAWKAALEKAGWWALLEKARRRGARQKMDAKIVGQAARLPTPRTATGASCPTDSPSRNSGSSTAAAGGRSERVSRKL